MTRQVAVVMSTYNGERYLEEQIESVLGQSVSVDLYIRDDGSSDLTRAIAGKYASNHDNVFIFPEKNVGCTISFLQTLRLVKRPYEYYAFCDQDDRWHSDKIERALALLSKYPSEAPLLYCSEYNYCDEDMTFQAKSKLNRCGVSFYKCLYENICSGNTMVFNRALYDRIIEADPSRVYCHDWWAALLATCFGNVVFDADPTLEYRRTGSNVSPTGSSSLSLLRFRIKTFFQNGDLKRITDQLGYFYKLYKEEMAPEYRSALTRCLEGGSLAKTTIPKRLRQKMSEELIIRVLLAAGLL